MPEPDTALEPVLADLTFAATQARLLPGAGEALADELETLIARYRTGAHRTAHPATDPVSPPAGRTTPVTGSSVVEAGAADGVDVHGADYDGAEAEESYFEDDALAYLRTQIDDIGGDVYADAVPHDITLFVRRVDGFGLSPDDARAAVTTVLPSLTEVIGPLAVTSAETDEDDPAQVNVLLTGDTDTRLELFGTGRDGFNADITLVGVGDITIRSKVGDVADPDAAADLGLLPPQLPEQPEGKHPINGTLGMLEEILGEPVADVTEIHVRYTRTDGQPLSSEQARTVLTSPVSTGPGGLRRFGAYDVTEILPGRGADERVARLTLHGDGEIDARTLAVATSRYSGTLPFDGLGPVTAQAFTTLNAALDLDDEDHEALP